MSGEARNSLSFRKLASHSSFHYVPSCFFNNLKIGLVVFSKNLDNATSLPMSLCTSFKVFGILISMIVTHFSELASIPLWVRMKPRNFPPCTPNMHFLEFNVMLYFHICVNISTKSSMWEVVFVLFTTKSSTYTSIFLLSWLINIFPNGDLPTFTREFHSQMKSWNDNS